MNTIKPFQKLSGSGLKIIAFVTMLIDHIGASILKLLWIDHPRLFPIYRISRGIGRIAFPIFIFLLIEGFLHTRNSKKYALRLFIASIISEIPYDLAFSQSLYYPEHQNVFFTLLLGFVALLAFEEYEKYLQGRKNLTVSALSFYELCGNLMIILATAGLAYYLKTDYSAFGVLAILVGYRFRTHPLPFFQNITPIVICLVLTVANPQSEGLCFLSLIPLYCYNKKKGALPKWFGYAFYPAHLLLLWCVLLALHIPMNY